MQLIYVDYTVPTHYLLLVIVIVTTQQLLCGKLVHNNVRSPCGRI